MDILIVSDFQARILKNRDVVLNFDTLILNEIFELAACSELFWSSIYIIDFKNLNGGNFHFSKDYS